MCRGLRLEYVLCFRTRKGAVVDGTVDGHRARLDVDDLLSMPVDHEAAGIGEGLLRVSVGLESVTDVKADLARGLG